MKTTTSILLGLALIVTPVAVARAQAPKTPAGAQPAAAPKGNVATGAQDYVKFGCYQCHGRAGQGGGGPRLGPSSLPWVAFEGYTREPTGQMPPYTAKILTEQQLADIYAFVVALPPPSPAARAMLTDK